MAALFDGYRVDHLVGFFRTYGKRPSGEAFFNPAEEPTQIAQGETLLRIFVESGAAIIGEDLGVIPPFVRRSLMKVGVPGCKVLRWERHWDVPGEPLVDPATFPALSAAMTGTHDTETLAEWWSREGDRDTPWSADVRDALLAAAYRSGSDDVFVPVQDVFGWTDRINVPATIGDHNWTWKLPWPVDRLGDEAGARERAMFCALAAEESGRKLPAHDVSG
jgi:4-alpha-glucanotransferase